MDTKNNELGLAAVNRLMPVYARLLASYKQVAREQDLKEIKRMQTFTRRVAQLINKRYLKSENPILSADWWRDVAKHFGIEVPQNILKPDIRLRHQRPVW